MEGGAGVLLVLPPSADPPAALPIADVRLFLHWFSSALNVLFVVAVYVRVVGIRAWNHFGPQARAAQRAMRDRRKGE